MFFVVCRFVASLLVLARFVFYVTVIINVFSLGLPFLFYTPHTLQILVERLATFCRSVTTFTLRIYLKNRKKSELYQKIIIFISVAR